MVRFIELVLLISYNSLLSVILVFTLIDNVTHFGSLQHNQFVDAKVTHYSLTLL